MTAAVVNAVILVAGVARRLAPLTDTTHKALLPRGRPSGARAHAGGAEGGRRAPGHAGGRALRRPGPPLAGERVGPHGGSLHPQPRIRRGSVLSLYAARQCLREPTLIMDADVLFPREFLRRLLALPAPERPARRPRLHRHRRGGEDLHPGRSRHRARQEGGAGGVGAGRRGHRLLQVRGRGRARAGALPRPGHRGEPRARRVGGRAATAGAGPATSAGRTSPACPGPRSTSSRTCAAPRPTCCPTSSGSTARDPGKPLSTSPAPTTSTRPASVSPAGPSPSASSSPPSAPASARVGVPAALRTPDFEAALATSPRARAAVAWLDTAATP